MAKAAGPVVVTYQGRVSVSGQPFTGAGQFKFALVSAGTNIARTATGDAVRTVSFITSVNITDGGAGYVSAPAVTISGGGGSGATATATVSGGAVVSITINNAGTGYTSTSAVTMPPPPAPSFVFATHWSQDGTSTAGSQPSGAISLPVAGGLFVVPLGDTNLAGMTAWPADVLTNPNVRLRLWFSAGSVTAASLSGNGATLTNLNAVSLTGTLADARFFTNVALLTGLNIFSWQTVAGTNLQVQTGKGYLLTNDALVTVTLPASPAPGEVIRVSGSGAGGWILAQNAGQSVIAKSLVPPSGVVGATWVPRETSRSWNSIASSADGTKLVAGVTLGQLHTSTDSGLSWTPRESARQWYALASSADGTRLAAVAGGYLRADPNSALELQHIGAGRFLPLSHEGILNAH